MAKWIQITNFINPDKMMETEYGRVSGRQWLRNESIRIGKKICKVTTYDSRPTKDDPKEDFNATTQDDYIALFRKA